MQQPPCSRVPHSRFRVWVTGLGYMFGFRVPGPGFRDSVFGFRVQCCRFRVSGKEEQPPWGSLPGWFRDIPLRLHFLLSEDVWVSGFGLRVCWQEGMTGNFGQGTPYQVIGERFLRNVLRLWMKLLPCATMLHALYRGPVWGFIYRRETLRLKCGPHMKQRSAWKERQFPTRVVSFTGEDQICFLMA